MNADFSLADASTPPDADLFAASSHTVCYHTVSPGPAAPDVRVSAAVAALMLSALYHGPRRAPVQERICRTAAEETARRIRRRTEKASRAQNRKRR